MRANSDTHMGRCQIEVGLPWGLFELSVVIRCRVVPIVFFAVQSYKKLSACSIAGSTSDWLRLAYMPVYRINIDCANVLINVILIWIKSDFVYKITDFIV